MKKSDPAVGPSSALSARPTDLELATELAHHLLQEPTNDPTLGLGNAGRALLFHYLGRAQADDLFVRAADEHLQMALDAAAQWDLPCDLHRGYLGIAWVLQHLSQDDPSAEEACADVDADIQQSLQNPEFLGFDLISGLSGLGIYALERIRYASGRSCLALVIRQLATRATNLGAGLIAWKTSGKQIPAQQSERFGAEGYYDVGVAHGTPGVIPVLAGAYKFDIEKPIARPLLEGAVAWVLAQRRAGQGFPNFVAEAAPNHRARLAWCYGEAGIAAVLACAADATGNRGWLAAALEIGRAAAARPIDDTQIVDASLCHGAAGLAQIFSRLFRYSPETVFIEAANFYSDYALELRNANGRFPYMAKNEDGTLKAVMTSSFLCGEVGVALSRVARVFDDAGWERLLGISLPPAR